MPPGSSSWRSKVDGAIGGPHQRSSLRGSAHSSHTRSSGASNSAVMVRVQASRSLSTLVTVTGVPFFGEDFGHAGHAAAPQVFELVERAPCPGHGGDLGAHERLPPAALLGHQAGALEHGHVLLDRGEAHRIGLGQPRYRRGFDRAAAQDVAPRRICEATEELIDRIYNHLVVR